LRTTAACRPFGGAANEVSRQATDTNLKRAVEPRIGQPMAGPLLMRSRGWRQRLRSPSSPTGKPDWPN